MTIDELQKRLDRCLNWQRDGNQDAQATACDAIHEVVRAEMPSAILYFRRVAPDETLQAAAEYLQRLEKRGFLIPPIEIGRIDPVEAEEISLSRQALYSEVYNLFFSSDR